VELLIAPDVLGVALPGSGTSLLKPEVASGSTRQGRRRVATNRTGAARTPFLTIDRRASGLCLPLAMTAA